MRYVLGSRASIGGVLGSGRGGAAGAWYLAGGVSAANCVAAYAPKGAASLAASYTNLANPGTYTAAPGTAPTFDTATGWTFAAASSQYLTTGITPGSTSWSAIVRFSDTSGGGEYCLLGAYTNSTTGFLIQAKTGTNHQYGNGGLLAKAGAIASGVLAFAGQTAYRDGSAETGTIAAGNVPSLQIYIGALNYQNGTAIQYEAGKIQAIAIYNVTLDAATVAAISTAMSLL